MALNAAASRSLIASWIDIYKIKKMYVVGSDDEKTSYSLVRKVIEAAILLCVVKPNLTRKEPLVVDGGKTKDWPKSVSEAVDRLVTNLNLKDKAGISGMQPSDLDELHFTLGMYITDNFGLWTGNYTLQRSCMQLLGAKEIIPDEASAVIIKKLWESLYKYSIVPTEKKIPKTIAMSGV